MSGSPLQGHGAIGVPLRLALGAPLHRRDPGVLGVLPYRRAETQWPQPALEQWYANHRKK